MKERQALRHNCQSCGVARNRGVHCAYCGALYIDTINTDTAEITYGALAKKFRVERRGNGVRIYWRWINSTIWFLIPFAIIWNTFIIKFVLEIINFSSISELPKAALLDPFLYLPIMHLGIGIGLVVFVIATLINSTSISADTRALKINHYPIPWRGARSIARNEIEQIFVLKVQYTNENRSRTVPTLQLVTTNNQRYLLLKGDSEDNFLDYEILRVKILKALEIDPVPMHSNITD